MCAIEGSQQSPARKHKPSKGLSAVAARRVSARGEARADPAEWQGWHAPKLGTQKDRSQGSRASQRFDRRRVTWEAAPGRLSIVATEKFHNQEVLRLAGRAGTTRSSVLSERLVLR